MMLVSRRKFVSLLGLGTAAGWAGVVGASGSPAEALSNILKDSHGKGEKPKATGSKKEKNHSATEKSPSAKKTGAHGDAAQRDHGAAEHKVLNTPEEIWTDLMQGNKRFVDGKPKARPLVASRAELYKGQHPQVIILGCADSRVSPELVFDKNLGELFVVRTAGNIADPIALGSLEYAAEHLHSKVLLVLGHEKCGAVAAAASGEKMPTPNLDAIVAKIAPVVEPFKTCATGDQLVGLGVEANVQKSARDIVENSPILQKEIMQRKLTVMTAVYRLRTGEIYRLS